MVHGDRTNINKFGKIVLVRNIVAMPSYNIERRVILCAFKELAAKFVDNFPRLLLDFIFSHRVEEVSSVGETISSKRSKFGQLEIGAPDFYDTLAH